MPACVMGTLMGVGQSSAPIESGGVFRLTVEGVDDENFVHLERTTNSGHTWELVAVIAKPVLRVAIHGPDLAAQHRVTCARMAPRPRGAARHEIRFKMSNESSP